MAFVAWDQERSQRVEQALHAGLTSQPWLEANIVAVANRDGLTLESETIRGTNEDGEFSGYEEGLAFLQEQGDADAWLLVNDRLLDYPLPPLRFLNPGVLAFVETHHVVVGPLDRLRSESTLLGHRVGLYCRSNYVLIGREALEKLGSLTTVHRDRVDSLRKAAGSSLRPLHGLHGFESSYADFVTEWLTGSRQPHWYQARPLTLEDQDWFWTKLQSILNETLLGARLQAQGELLLSPLHAGLLGRVADPNPAIAELRREPWAAVDFYGNRAARLRLAAAALLP